MPRIIKARAAAAAVNQVKNLVHNGRGRIQKRVDGALSNSFVFGGDRWAFQADGTVGAGTITTVTNATAGDTGSAHKLSGVTLTGAGKVRGRSRYESLDAIEFKDKEFIVSASVFHDVGSAIDYTITVNKADVLDDFSAVTQVAVSSAISVSTSTDISISLAIGDMGDVTNGIEIIIEADSGAITTKNFEFTDIQGEEASTVRAFEFRPIAKELTLLERYYRRLNTRGLNGLASATTTWIFAKSLIPEMRTAPTATLLDTTPNVRQGGSGFTGSGSAISGSALTSTGIDVSINGFTGLTSGAATLGNESNDLIELDAELN